MIEESLFERRYVGDQAGPGLLARVVTQYDDVALYPPAYFHPTVAESKVNPDAGRFLLAAHLFAGTWVEGSRARHHACGSPMHLGRGDRDRDGSADARGRWSGVRLTPRSGSKEHAAQGGEVCRGSVHRPLLPRVCPRGGCFIEYGTAPRLSGLARSGRDDLFDEAPGSRAASRRLRRDRVDAMRRVAGGRCDFGGTWL